MNKSFTLVGVKGRHFPKKATIPDQLSKHAALVLGDGCVATLFEYGC